ncbi:MAG: amidohydrolase [Pedosphaera sp.]|nr:amidohydrolase [Pedosphaera sp.]
MMSASNHRIDSHQHFWKYDAQDYPWIGQNMIVLKRDYLPADWSEAQGQTPFQSSIAVQARQSLHESRWLLELADHHDSIVGVVGWVDLCAPTVGRDLEALARHPKFVGVRHVVQEEPDVRFMMQPVFLRGISLLEPLGLTYDILIFPNQLPAAIELARQFPSQPFVLDHIAKPHIKQNLTEPWSEQIAELAACPNVYCKLSGMLTEAVWGQWRPEQFKPYFDCVWQAFGPDRLMIGSDWPVCLLAASYSDAMQLVIDDARTRGPTALDGLLGGNAKRFYLG